MTSVNDPLKQNTDMKVNKIPDMSHGGIRSKTIRTKSISVNSIKQHDVNKVNNADMV